MTSWWVQENGYTGILAGSNYGSGGGYGTGGTNSATSGAVQFRSPLDAARASHGQIPQAQFPDGYLGNIIDRHSDKLLQHVSSRMTAQSYQRGVHKGSRIDPKGYFWPDDEVQPDDGLARQAAAQRSGGTIQVQRSAPKGNPVEMLAHQGRTSGMASPGMLGQKMQEARSYGVDPATNPIVLQSMAPKYRIASRSKRDGTFESGK